MTFLLPPGTHDASGKPISHGTRETIAGLARLSLAGHAIASLWQRRDCHAEALALFAKTKSSASLGLASLFALGLYHPFLEMLGTKPVHGSLVAARGLARFALGDTGTAAGDLEASLVQSSGWGLWLRAACALAIMDPIAARNALKKRGNEPVATLLLANLALRAGEIEQAKILLQKCTAAIDRPMERELLSANIAAIAGDTAAYGKATEQALKTFGLRSYNAPTARLIQEGPTVSVILAAYNAERTIGEALCSLTRQSWKKLEIIVVDDASTDRTADFAATLAKKDQRIRFISLKANSGAYVARNIGLAAATGEFIAFHDADDIAHPERIARQMAPLIANPKLAFTLARWIRRDTNRQFCSRQILPLVRLHVGSMIVRAPFLAAIGQFDPVRYGADNDLLLRLKVAAGRRHFAMLNLPLTIGGFDPHSATNDPNTGFGDRGYSASRQAYSEARIHLLIQQLIAGASVR